MELLLRFCLVFCLLHVVWSRETSYTVFDEPFYPIRTTDKAEHKAIYQKLLFGCLRRNKTKCRAEEEFRLEMNRQQPEAMRNFTSQGFALVSGPPSVEQLQALWRRHSDEAQIEWHEPTVYHNSNASPTHYLSLKELAPDLKTSLVNEMRDILEEWTDQHLRLTSFYGMREYSEGAVLAPHVDRLPLVVSAILNVDQDVDEAWPLEVFDHEGVAHNVTMQPTQMILYESASVVHGRPFPLRGRSYCNVFAHFEALGPRDAAERAGEANILPQYMIDDRPWSTRWRAEHPAGWNALRESTEAVLAGDLRTLVYIARINPAGLRTHDEFGWEAIHEACRQGRLEVVKFLLEQGIDVQTRTKAHMTPLKVASVVHGNEHPLTIFLAKLVLEQEVEETRKMNERYERSREHQQSALNPNDDGVVLNHELDYSRTTATNSYTCFDDMTWPIRTANVSTVFGDKQALYDKLMMGCRAESKDAREATLRCEMQEVYRMEMNTFQPSSVYNYTRRGFLKTRVPKNVFALIREFWERNKDKSKAEFEFPTTFHNNYEAPPSMVSLSDRRLPGAGRNLIMSIANAAHNLMERWVGQHLASSSVYGIRIYHNNSILTPHVDRLPLITSAIINVDQDVDEPWPLEVYDHDGVAYNITMEPGDMILYESHSIIHGRPFPLQGRFFANVFLHWESLGPLDSTTPRDNGGLPPYIIPGSYWEKHWRRDFPKGWTILEDAHVLVDKGDINTLKYLCQTYPEPLFRAKNGDWKPLHEAIRRGNTQIVRLLLKCGADPSEVTDDRTPLELAKVYLGRWHEITHLLEDLTPNDGLRHEHAHEEARHAEAVHSEL